MVLLLPLFWGYPANCSMHLANLQAVNQLLFEGRFDGHNADSVNVLESG
jgi:hypothetical protein